MPIQRQSRALTLTTIAFFVAFLITGLLVFKDYGMSWDEIPTREFGVMNVAHQVPDAWTLDSVRTVKGPAYERFGPVFEILLVRAEMLARPADMRATFLLRHLLTFLTFYLGVLLFHQLCRRRFGGGLALLASLCLVLSPQLFAHAFYNVKDISFLTSFVATMLTLDTLLQHPSARITLMHGVTTTIAMGTRVLGLFTVMLTVVAAIALRPSRRTLLLLTGYGMLIAVLLPVVWPVLRIDPLGIVKNAVLGATTNPYTKTNLFRGEQILATALPRDYVPTWILITTPYVVTLLFLVGAGRVVTASIRQPRAIVRQEQMRDLIVFAWFFLPVVGCVVLRPIMYDGWRHLFFVYPALVYLAAIGMEALHARAVARFGNARRRSITAGLTAALLLSLAPVCGFMFANHPFEHLYFNRLAGRDMATVKQRFELDYWGLTYRPALEYIVRTDSSAIIRILVANFPGRVNALMLPAADRARLRYVNSEEDADYFISNYRFHPEPYPVWPEVFSVRVGNASIASVFRIRHTP